MGAEKHTPDQIRIDEGYARAAGREHINLVSRAFQGFAAEVLADVAPDGQGGFTIVRPDAIVTDDSVGTALVAEPPALELTLLDDNAAESQTEFEPVRVWADFASDCQDDDEQPVFIVPPVSVPAVDPEVNPAPIVPTVAQDEISNRVPIFQLSSVGFSILTPARRFSPLLHAALWRSVQYMIAHQHRKDGVPFELPFDPHDFLKDFRFQFVGEQLFQFTPQDGPTRTASDVDVELMQMKLAGWYDEREDWP